MLCSRINKTKKPCQANKAVFHGALHLFFVEGIPHLCNWLVDFGVNSCFYFDGRMAYILLLLVMYD